MKPFFTHARPTLIETVPKCCLPLARLLTTREQFGIVINFHLFFSFNL